MSGFKGNNFLRIYKRYEPSFWSKEKDYSGFIRTRQYTVFTTDYYSNRGLFIPVHSVWYIYIIAPYNIGFNDSHFLLTRVHFHDSSHQRIVVHGCAFFFVRSASEDDLRNLHHAVCGLPPRLRLNHLLWKSSALFCRHGLRLSAVRNIGRGVCYE